ncbi:MAG TPA: hypothetical protein VJA21_18985 [Verrucomicrobiae bacterium]
MVAHCLLRPGRLPCLQLVVSALLCFGAPTQGRSSSAPPQFQQAAALYRAGDFAQAAEFFSHAARSRPSSGALQNLGNAEWRNGRAGYAVLAWEQTLWLDPFNTSARNNLQFARKSAQLEAPELAWYEVVSTWLPLNWWAWIAGISFWFAVGIGAGPGILRMRKAAWQQGLAAFALAVFLLSVPAHFGVATRSRLGFVLEKNTPLRLTATEEAQYLTRLQAGEPARLERVRGQYILVRTTRALGWIRKDQFGLTCPPE